MLALWICVSVFDTDTQPGSGRHGFSPEEGSEADSNGLGHANGGIGQHWTTSASGGTDDNRPTGLTRSSGPCWIPCDTELGQRPSAPPRIGQRSGSTQRTSSIGNESSGPPKHVARVPAQICCPRHCWESCPLVLCQRKRAVFMVFSRQYDWTGQASHFGPFPEPIHQGGGPANAASHARKKGITSRIQVPLLGAHRDLHETPVLLVAGFGGHGPHGKTGSHSGARTVRRPSDSDPHERSKANTTGQPGARWPMSSEEGGTATLIGLKLEHPGSVEPAMKPRRRPAGRPRNQKARASRLGLTASPNAGLI